MAVKIYISSLFALAAAMLVAPLTPVGPNVGLAAISLLAWAVKFAP